MGSSNGRLESREPSTAIEPGHRLPARSGYWIAGIGIVAALLVLGSILTASPHASSSEPQKPASVPAPTEGMSNDGRVVAENGITLGNVTSPPKATHAALSAGTLAEDSIATIAFSPYGTGTAKNLLVIKVGSAKPADSTKDSQKLAKMLESQNLMVRGAPEVIADVQIGGDYEGRIGLLTEGEQMHLVLESAEGKR